jgi:hypothetical protein
MIRGIKMNTNDFSNFISQIDYNSILKIFGPILWLQVLDTILDNRKLHKSYEQIDLDSIGQPADIIQEYDSLNNALVLKGEFSLLINHFIETVTKNMPKEDLVLLYNNLNTLKINKNNLSLYNFIHDSSAIGTYDSIKNVISINKNEVASSIFHELFHMMSTYSEGDYNYCGFEQVLSGPIRRRLAVAINEGYTQYLSEKYFGNIRGVKGTYPFQVHIVKLLEKVVDKDNMQHLYCNANLYGLVEELKKYASVDEIEKFITGTDFLLRYIADTSLSFAKREMITNSLINVNTFLLRSYAFKLKYLLDNNCIDDDEFSMLISNYVNSLGTGYRVRKTDYNYFTVNSIKENIDDIFGEGKTDFQLISSDIALIRKL